MTDADAGADVDPTAEADPLAAAPANTLPLFVFRLGERWFALPPEQVASVSQDDLPRTLVPLAPSYVQGVVNYRGQALAVIDPSSFLDLRERDQGSRLLVVRAGELEAAFPSPEVRGVLSCPRDEVRPAEDSMRYARGVIDLEVGVTQLLDLGGLLETAAELRL
jgi:purine-binding chemotaxis protein CheW